MAFEYDVFLSYNNLDAAWVGQVATALESRGLHCCFDKVSRPDPAGFRIWMEKALDHSGTVAVFLGTSGIGSYQEFEIDVAINQQLTKKRGVIPVLLPGLDSKDPKIPSSLRRYSWLEFPVGLNDVAKLDQLYFMITGKRTTAKPVTVTPVPTPAEGTDRALDYLANALDSRKITFFLGGRCSPCEPDMAPMPWAITRQLLADLQLQVTDSDTLLPSLDTVGAYYSLKEGVKGMEQKVSLYIRNSSRLFPELHHKLARLIGLLAARESDRRLLPWAPAHPSADSGVSSDPQLVVTTSLDTSLEHAFLREELSFSRIVQHRDGWRSEVTYRQVKRLPSGQLEVVYGTGDRRTFDPNDTKELDRCISGPPQRRKATQPPLAVERLAPLILYKYHGSQDVPDSCTISTDHMFDTTRIMKVPQALTSIISNTPSLFMGCGLLDSDFRHLYHTILKKAFDGYDGDKRYFLLLAPNEAEGRYRRMESSVWGWIKDGAAQEKILVIEKPADVFLEDLIRRVAPTGVMAP